MRPICPWLWASTTLPRVARMLKKHELHETRNFAFWFTLNKRITRQPDKWITTWRGISWYTWVTICPHAYSDNSRNPVTFRIPSESGFHNTYLVNALRWPSGEPMSGKNNRWDNGAWRVRSSAKPASIFLRARYHRDPHIWKHKSTSSGKHKDPPKPWTDQDLNRNANVFHPHGSWSIRCTTTTHTLTRRLPRCTHPVHLVRILNPPANDTSCNEMTSKHQNQNEYINYPKLILHPQTLHEIEWKTIKMNTCTIATSILSPKTSWSENRMKWNRMKQNIINQMVEWN